MKRRTFLNGTGIGLLASYFPVALATSQTNDDSNTAAQTTSIGLGLF